MSLDRDIDRLYQLPLEQFTEARNALVARLRTLGEAADAERVKGLEKPSVSAWAVNQLYWRAGRDYDELVAAGTRLRQAQERSLKGGSAADVRDASEAKDRTVAAALRATVELLQRASGDVSPAIRQRIAATLEAVAIHGGMGQAAPGRLVDELPLPGFSALAALAPARLSLRDLSRRVTEARARGREEARAQAKSDERARAIEVERARVSEVERRARVDRARTDLAAAESEARAAREALMKASLAEHEAAVKADTARLAVKEAKAHLMGAMTQATRLVDAHKRARRLVADAQAARERAEKAVADRRAALKKAQS